MNFKLLITWKQKKKENGKENRLRNGRKLRNCLGTLEEVVFFVPRDTPDHSPRDSPVSSSPYIERHKIPFMIMND
jgi:hypothetical protein